jgi:beta-glucosidase/6-phospho-beta-glucosidase/beta-galactosidase
MELCRHYERWQQDFHLTRDLGVRCLRYGPPYYRMHRGPGRYDWDWTDMVLPEMRRLGIVPIIDLCHFGVPDWLGDFQNPEWPDLFADYARAFAARYPWVRLYTPVNEMYVAAKFSGLLGWWNERLCSNRGFVTALKHLVRANVEAMHAILEARPDALFIQSESSEYFHTHDPDLLEEAERANERRFLALDLNYGHPISAAMFEYLMENGMTAEEYHYFARQNVREHCVMGNDYYVTNEHMLTAPGRTEMAGEVFGYYVITHEYYRRYNLPVMHTETNCRGDLEAKQWLWKTWSNILRLRQDGVPLCGMTWYSLTDQVDWDTVLREENGHANPFGLYDMDRKPRPVAEAYRDLIRRWRDIPLLPNGPLTLAGEWGDPDDTASDKEARIEADARQEESGGRRV